MSSMKINCQLRLAGNKPRGVFIITVISCLSFVFSIEAQTNWDSQISQRLAQTLKTHKDFVGLKNVASNKQDMMVNVSVAMEMFKGRGFKVSLLESNTLPVFFAEYQVDPNAKTLLYYLHLDGQAVNPARWDQPDPFSPVLKAKNNNGAWDILDWDAIKGDINPEWRIFGRAAADDKAPIMMLLTAMDILNANGEEPAHNIKVILDLQEEAGSEGFLSTLDTYRETYAADYMIIMDGPAHPSNAPTLTFGCRGIARCSITVYGAKLPQHSGHYGNIAPNPIFKLSHLLASMKDKNGIVTIKDYYQGIELSKSDLAVLNAVPDNTTQMLQNLGLNTPDKVAETYQAALQYPSLNVRHIETSWKGPGLKTIIPEWVTAHLDVRLVLETDGARQLEKIKQHLIAQGYYVIDREPTNQERLDYPNIVSFKGNSGVNAFRTPMDSPFGLQLSNAIAANFGTEPIKIRTMGGTVPIIPAVNALDIPAIIVPLVNMDNNQHNPNENIRIGNITQGIKVCLSMLTTSFKE